MSEDHNVIPKAEHINIPVFYVPITATKSVRTRKIEAECHAAGHSLVYVALDNQLAGAIELRPTIRVPQG